MFKNMLGILQDATKPSGDPGRFPKCVSHRGCLLTQCCVNQIQIASGTCLMTLSPCMFSSGQTSKVLNDPWVKSC